MSHRVLILSIAVLHCVAVAGCAASPATLLVTTPTSSVTAVRAQTPTVVVTITYPTRVAAPVVTVAPDLTAPYIPVVMANFRFDPSTLKARVGQPIRLELQNTDVLRHNFSIDDSDIDVSVLPGFSQRIDFVISKPGSYVFACNLTEEGDHRAAGMVGMLIVETVP